MRHWLIWLVFFALLGGWLTACQSCPAVSLPPVLATDECAPPCWSGITPGKSTLVEVQRIVKTLPGVDTASIQQDYDVYKEYERDAAGNLVDYQQTRLRITWNFSTTQPHSPNYPPSWLEFGGAVYLDAEQASEIDLVVPRATGLSVASALKRFGQPASILACSPGGELADFVKLIYPEQGLVLSVYNNCPNQWTSGTFSLKAEAQITELIFFDPGRYEEILLSRVLAGAYLGAQSQAARMTKIESLMQDWQGLNPRTPYTSQRNCWLD